MVFQNLEYKYEIFGVSIPWIAAVFGAITIISGLVLWQTIRLRRNEEPKPKSLDSLRKRNDLFSAYLIAYIFPFVNLNYSDITSWITLSIFFVVLASIQLRSNQLHINPVLAIIGYDVYEVENAEKGTTDLVLAHKSKNLGIGDDIEAVQVGPNIYITP
jgi:hypothetical protein